MQCELLDAAGPHVLSLLGAQPARLVGMPDVATPHGEGSSWRVLGAFFREAVRLCEWARLESPTFADFRGKHLLFQWADGLRRQDV